MGEPFAEFLRERLGAFGGGPSRFLWSTLARSRAQRCFRFDTEIRDPFKDLPVSYAGVDPVPGLERY